MKTTIGVLVFFVGLSLSGCGDDSDSAPSFGPSTPSADTADGSTKPQELLTGNPGKALTGCVNKLTRTLDSLPRIGVADSQNILSGLLNKNLIVFLENAETDSQERLIQGILGLKALRSAGDYYARGLGRGQSVSREFVALLRQGLKVAAAVSGIVREMESASGAPLEDERLFWRIGLIWNDFADALLPECWDNLSTEDRISLATGARSALPSLAYVSFEAVRSGLLPRLPDDEAIDSPKLKKELSELRSELIATGFRSHSLGDPLAPFALESVDLPTFPPLPVPAFTIKSQAVAYEISLAADSDGGPGSSAQLRVLLPPGEHSQHSLPCVFICPAGTDLEAGADLDLDSDEPNLDEALPYVKAGMAVVEYSLDGAVPAGTNEFDLTASVAAYLTFRKAMAGVVNARNALEFVLLRVPEVDPRQCYSAGHSSAGNVALLFAAHEPRLAGAIAFAAAPDVVRINWSLRGHDASIKPGAHSFRIKSSPTTHVSQLTCPVFLFHATDDDTVSVQQTSEFATLLKDSGKDVTVVTVDRAGHYTPMIEDGIPAAIKWLKELVH